MLVAVPALVAQAGAAYDVSNPPSFSFVVDEGQVDDYPNQKDLNAQGVATPEPGVLWFAVKWDDLDFSGANTGDACALFDTDVDSNANYAICVTIQGSPATEKAGSPTFYSCGDKSKEKCTSKYVVIDKKQTACTVTTASDAFPNEHPGQSDTLARCRVDLTAFTDGGTPNLINTCSYPSGQPTSDPSDCVLVPRDAFIRVKKITNAATSDTFDFTLAEGAGTATTPAQFDDVAGAVSPGTTTLFVGIRSDRTYSLAEIVTAGWGITGTPSCANTSGTADNLGSYANGTISGIDAKSDGQITCTFNNALQTGGLSVHKYIDIDESGTEQVNSESTIGIGSAVIGADLTGWSFTLTKGSFTCTGTTNSSGVLTSCGSADVTALLPGTYTVTENASNPLKTIGDNGATAFNTDPGTAPAALPVSDTTVTVTAGQTTNVSFGNTCYNTATFEVTGVAGTPNLVARYWTVDANSKTTVALSQVGATTTWRGSTSNSIRRGVVVHWEYGLSGGSQFAPGPDATMPGYPACGQTKSAAFGNATISGLKYKDTDNSGTKNGTESGTPGFTIQLKQGATVVASTMSDATGGFSFASVAPGTYTLHEPSTTGWDQTEPASDGDITVVVPIGAGGTISEYGNAVPIRFGNTPKSDIQVTFRSLGNLRTATGADDGPATKATAIDCTHAGADVGSSANSNTNTTNALTLDKSTVTCVITYGTAP